MAQRVVIGLEPGANWTDIKNRLVAAGAESAGDPSAALPDAVVVTIASDRNLDQFLQESRKLPGVRYAEPDAWRSTS